MGAFDSKLELCAGNLISDTTKYNFMAYKMHNGTYSFKKVEVKSTDGLEKESSRFVMGGKDACRVKGC